MLGAEPPVDAAARAEVFRGLIEGDGAPVVLALEDDGRIIGHAVAKEGTRGVFSLGMAILPESRGRGGGRMLLERVAEHARRWARTSSSWRCGRTRRVTARCAAA